MHYMTIFALLLGLLTSPAMAQETPPVAPATTEEAAPADEVVEAAPEAAPEAPVEGEAAPVAVEGEEAAAEAVEGGESEEAPKAPVTDEEAVQTALSLVEALKAGQWPLAAGLFLTLLVYLVNRFALKDMVGEKVVPWVAGGVGVAGAVGVGLLTGMPVVEAIVAGVMAGVMAVGGWEALVKHIVPKKAPAEPLPEAPKAPAEPLPKDEPAS
jgi:hypothetical protein